MDNLRTEQVALRAGGLVGSGDLDTALLLVVEMPSNELAWGTASAAAGGGSPPHSGPDTFNHQM